jgi:hypothetical protein
VVGASLYAFFRSPPTPTAPPPAAAPPDTEPAVVEATDAAAWLPEPAVTYEPMPSVLPLNPAPSIAPVGAVSKPGKTSIQCPPGSFVSEERDGDHIVSAGCIRVVDGGHLKVGTWSTLNPLGQTFGGRYHENGKVDGVWTTYFPDGHKAEEATYDHGKYEGWFTQWNEKGEKILERLYRNDRLDGPFIVYFSDGSVKKQLYRDGVKVSEVFLLPDGTVAGAAVDDAGSPTP